MKPQKYSGFLYLPEGKATILTHLHVFEPFWGFALPFSMEFAHSRRVCVRSFQVLRLPTAVLRRVAELNRWLQIAPWCKCENECGCLSPYVSPVMNR